MLFFAWFYEQLWEVMSSYAPHLDIPHHEAPGLIWNWKSLELQWVFETIFSLNLRFYTTLTPINVNALFWLLECQTVKDSVQK